MDKNTETRIREDVDVEAFERRDHDRWLQQRRQQRRVREFLRTAFGEVLLH